MHKSRLIIKLNAKFEQTFTKEQEAMEKPENRNKPIIFDDRSLEEVLKLVNIIEFLAHNQLNLALLSKYKCHQKLFDGLVFYSKYFGMMDKSKLSKEQLGIQKRLILSLMKCLTVCFRSYENIELFLSSKKKAGNVKKLTSIVEDHMNDEDIALHWLLLLHQLLCDDIDIYTLISHQIPLEGLSKLLDDIQEVHMASDENSSIAVFCEVIWCH